MTVTTDSTQHCLLFMSSAHKLNAFSIFTKHFHACGHNICSLKCNNRTRSTDFFFPSSQFHRFVRTIELTSAYDFFLPLWSRERSSSHLKEATYGFSLVNSNRQHHCSGTSGPFLSAISYRNTRKLHHTLRCCNGCAVNQDGYWLTYGQSDDLGYGWDGAWLCKISSHYLKWHAA